MYVRLEHYVSIEQGSVLVSLPTPPIGQGRELYVCMYELTHL